MSATFTTNESSQSVPRPTLASVARIAGVSRQTVSNVLAAPERVSPATLAHVQEIIKQVGYRPNLAARQLRTGRSRVIGFRLYPVTDGINGAVLDRFLHALTEQAQADGYRIVLFTADDDADEVLQYRSLLDTTDIDAFVLSSTHHGDVRTQWLCDEGIPFVTFGRPWAIDVDPDQAKHSWVDVDGAAGTMAATGDLWDRGHRRIGYLGWPEGSGVGDERRRGWAEALAQRGATASDIAALDHGTLDGVRNGEVAATALIESAAPTAIVCASDSIALGAIEAVQLVEQEIEVIGFDDTPVAAAIGLSSVAQPLTEAARVALDLLLVQLGERPGFQRQHVLLDAQLVLRAR